MCRPSLEPGGVSSPAEADALADADADCEVVIDSFADGAYPPRLAKGLIYEMCCELLLFSELCDAEMLELCWCLVLGGAFMVMGVVAGDDDE